MVSWDVGVQVKRNGGLVLHSEEEGVVGGNNKGKDKGQHGRGQRGKGKLQVVFWRRVGVEA